MISGAAFFVVFRRRAFGARNCLKTELLGAPWEVKITLFSHFWGSRFRNAILDRVGVDLGWILGGPTLNPTAPAQAKRMWALFRASSNFFQKMLNFRPNMRPKIMTHRDKFASENESFLKVDF